ncbi:thioredoxin domain-containing protein [Salinibacterium sp. NG22]|uniref:DsbA family protein n=1 Tax=Salinibacterium sp. NG22 TaxID=2792040 RepID=UPI0018CF8064|nr:thioredoxin domain-containing protein [Salinibacterium sp. NG22]MBH0108665.1 thioredoxin domain-containing protein [Salinibacterium sp. NG22]
MKNSGQPQSNRAPRGRRKYSRKQLGMLLGGLGALALLTVAFVAGAQANSGSSTPQALPSVSAEEGSEPTIDLARRIEGDPTAMGAIDAPVVLVEYADYRCPFCGVLSRETLPELISEYVDAGQLRIEWRDYPIFGETSVMAAVAAHAAGEQGLFWEYNTAVYESAPETGHLEIDREKLLAYARDIGVPDLAQFEADLSSPALIARVQANVSEAQQIGVSSVPSIVIDDVPIAGAQPLQVFRDVIDEQLRLAGQ